MIDGPPDHKAILAPEEDRSGPRPDAAAAGKHGPSPYLVYTCPRCKAHGPLVTERSGDGTISHVVGCKCRSRTGR